MAKKTGFRIGEVCRELDLQPYVLRYWETEFPVLQPPPGATTQRSYGEREVEVLRRLKTLLYDEGYTIAGAKKKLEGELAAGFPLAGAAGSLFAGEAGGGAEASGAVAGSPSLPALDSVEPQRIEHVRSAIAAALVEAKEIQSLLRRDPAREPR